ncbi:MAG: hypothetical protein WCF85_08825 [Rhodospirillaceae bacterium]
MMRWRVAARWRVAFVLLIVALPAGAADERSPLKQETPKLKELMCWQAGVQVVSERDIERVTSLNGSLTLRKTDGTFLTLIDSAAPAGLCLLRERAKP